MTVQQRIKKVLAEIQPHRELHLHAAALLYEYRRQGISVAHSGLSLAEKQQAVAVARDELLYQLEWLLDGFRSPVANPPTPEVSEPPGSDLARS